MKRGGGVDVLFGLSSFDGFDVSIVILRHLFCSFFLRFFRPRVETIYEKSVCNGMSVT